MKYREEFKEELTTKLLDQFKEHKGSCMKHIIEYLNSDSYCKANIVQFVVTWNFPIYDIISYSVRDKAFYCINTSINMSDTVEEPFSVEIPLEIGKIYSL